MAINAIEFIIGLMRENTNALGFIPRPALAKQFIATDRFILQLNRFGKPIGYLLHGPRHEDGRMHVAQACIQLDKRNQGFGSAVVHELISRATAARATHIFLRCALDLQACMFWRTAGFTPIDVLPGGKRRRRTIIRFRYDLTKYLVRTSCQALALRSEILQAVFRQVRTFPPGSQQRKTKG